MQLTFESLAELQDFVQWVQAARQVAPIEPTKATIVVKDLPIGDGETVDEVIATPAAQVAQVADNPAEPRRKRRTKAEMEAARAAAPDLKDELTEAVVDVVIEAAEVAEQRPVAETAASAEFDKGDAVEFIKSRLAERPEISQVEHLNLARTFIGKHGLEKYNQSFPLAGLTPNVMGYSPADCATHAAALDFLNLE